MVQYCIDSFPGYDLIGPRGRFDTIFWLEIQKSLVYLIGHPKLSRVSTTSPGGDAVAFLLECDDKVFLHFVELICQVESFWHSNVTPDEFVQTINQFLVVDDLPYALTDFSWEEFEEFRFGAPRKSWELSAHPQIIRRESGILHQTAIEPTLQLLSAPYFVAANKEFLGGLADYRSGDYEDCVAKCVSAFESILKVVCQRKGWPYKQTDTADTLLASVFGKTNLEGFYKEHIKLVLTVRNRQSSAHGGGAQPKQVPKHVANYVINATAAAILLTVEETQL